MSQWDDFDCTLATSLSQLPPPDEGMDAVTPWRRAMNQIVSGLCLTCFTLNFLGLQYLLPANPPVCQLLVPSVLYHQRM